MVSLNGASISVSIIILSLIITWWWVMIYCLCSNLLRVCQLYLDELNLPPLCPQNMGDVIFEIFYYCFFWIVLCKRGINYGTIEIEKLVEKIVRYFLWSHKYWMRRTEKIGFIVYSCIWNDLGRLDY